MPIGGRRRIRALDGVRGLAIIFVVVAHFFDCLGRFSPVPGGLGVTIFFILSGYLITRLILADVEAGRFTMGRFFRRRFARIAPALILSYLLALAASLANDQDLEPRAMLLQVLFLSNYVQVHALGAIPIGTGVLWSLAIEEQFYLVFPSVLLLLRRSSPTRACWVLFGLLSTALACRIYYRIGLHASELTTYKSTECRFDSLLWGCLLAYARHFQVWTVLGPGAVIRTLAGLALLIASLVYRDPGFRETWRYTIQGLAICWILAGILDLPTGVASRWLAWRPLTYVGEISYSLYLVHWLAFMLLPAAHFGVTGPCVAMIISCAWAAVSHRWVEVPMRNWINGDSSHTIRIDRAAG